MADTFGGIELPIPLPPPGEGVSEPFLRYSLAYFQAVVNANCGEIWRYVAPGEGAPIKTTHDYDPEDGAFIERELPCLYMWRQEMGKTPPEWLAEDYLTTHDVIRMQWILPPCPVERHKKRLQIVNGITKSFAKAIELARDPSWVLDEDPDPTALEYGSVYPRFAQYISLTIDKWARRVFVVKDENTNKSYGFDSFETMLEVQEQLVRDVTKYALTGAALTTANRGGVEAGGVVMNTRNLT